MIVELEYCPCDCSPHEQPLDGERVAGEAVAADAPEYFDRERVAAMRARQAAREGLVLSIHHRGTHVRAAIIDGVRYEVPRR